MRAISGMVDLSKNVSSLGRVDLPHRSDSTIVEEPDGWQSAVWIVGHDDAGLFTEARRVLDHRTFVEGVDTAAGIVDGSELKALITKATIDLISLLESLKCLRYSLKH